MSHSYKKTPIVKYAPSGNIGQKLANRRVRRYKGDIPNKGYKFLKKIFNSWEVHDHVERYTLNDALNYRTKILSLGEHLHWGKQDEDIINIHKCVQRWKKWYWRK